MQRRNGERLLPDGFPRHARRRSSGLRFRPSGSGRAADAGAGVRVGARRRRQVRLHRRGVLAAGPRPSESGLQRVRRANRSVRRGRSHESESRRVQHRRRRAQRRLHRSRLCGLVANARSGDSALHRNLPGKARHRFAPAHPPGTRGGHRARPARCLLDCPPRASSLRTIATGRCRRSTIGGMSLHR
jgi:hypothetical protein